MLMIRALATALLAGGLTACSMLSSGLTGELGVARQILAGKQSLQAQDLSSLDRPAYAVSTPGIGEFLARLSRQDGDRRSFLVLNGRLLQYRQNRIDLTEGFETDIRWHEPRPNPATVLMGQSSASECWQASLSASGALQATRYLVKGCLRVEPSKEPGVLAVVESLDVPGVELGWENHYWFDSQYRLIRADEQPGPAMPRWKTRVLRAVPDDWPQGPFTVSPPGQGVTVTVRGLRQATINVPPTIKATLQPWLQVPDVDWAATRLYRLDNNAELEGRKQALLDELQTLADDFTFNDDRTGKAHIEKLIAEVKTWRMAQQVWVKAHPARLDWLPELDHALVGKHYLLELRKSPEVVPVFGGPGPLTVPFYGAPLTGLARLARTEASDWLQLERIWRVRPGVRPQVYRLNDDAGDLQLQPNDELVYLWKERCVPGRYRDLSRRLMALLPHRLPVDE